MPGNSTAVLNVRQAQLTPQFAFLYKPNWARRKCRPDVAKKLVRIMRYGLRFLASRTTFASAQNPLYL